MRAQEERTSDLHYGSILQSDLFKDQSSEPKLCLAERTFDAHALLFQPGSCSDSIYILRSGNAAILVDSISHNKISTMVEPGRMYGVLETVGGDPMWYAMKAETQCKFDVVRRDEFLAGLSSDPALCFRLAQILSRMNREILLSVAVC